MFRAFWSIVTGYPDGNLFDIGAYRVCALSLILGFLLPIVAPNGILFVNFYVLGVSGVPGTVIFLALYPLLAGVATFVAASSARGIARGLATAGIGFLPILVFLAEKGSSLGDLIPVDTPSSVAAFITTISLFGIAAAGIALCHQRENNLAVWIGATSGGLYFLSLLVPKASSVESMPIYAPFLAMQSRGFLPLVAGLGLLTSMVLLILSCVFLMLRAFAKPANPDFGRKAFLMFMWAVLALVITVFFGMTASTSGSAFIYIVIAFLKVFFWFMPALVLIPLGVADYLLEFAVVTGEVEISPEESAYRAPHAAAPPHAAGAPHHPGAPAGNGAAAGGPTLTRAAYERKLSELDALRNQGRIDNAEYWRQREELLKQ